MTSLIARINNEALTIPKDVMSPSWLSEHKDAQLATIDSFEVRHDFQFRYAVNSVLLNNRGKKFLDSEFILGVEPRPKGETATPWFELDANGTDKDHLIREVLEREVRLPQDKAVLWSAVGTRSAVIFDLDYDGDLDIVTNDFNTRPLVLISDLADSGPGVNFIKIDLQGTKSNRDGLGAVVRLVTGKGTQMQVNDGHSGHLSHCTYPLYFGLGDSDSIERIEVRWPSGISQTIDKPKANTTILVVEADPSTTSEPSNE